MEDSGGVHKGKHEGMLQRLDEWVEEKGREVYTLIGGNFNARMGVEGRGWDIGFGGEGNKKEEDGKESLRMGKPSQK